MKNEVNRALCRAKTKLFLKVFMLLFVLGMSTNLAWGSMNDIVANLNLDEDAMKALRNKTYCARLTGEVSSTGGGKVYVNAPELGQSSTADPRNGNYVPGESNVAVNGMGITMSEMTRIGINAWAESDDGYYFAGFSYANMGTDLGLNSEGAQMGLYAETYVIGAQAGETIDYVIYGTFEPIRITGYTLGGDNTTDEGTCTQTVSFTFSGNSEEISIADFESLAITSSTGGSWTNEDGNNLSISDLSVNSEAKTGTVSVKFTAPNSDVAEYSANLQLKTKAEGNIAINVPLNARTVSSGAEALLFDGKTPKETSTTTLSGLLNVDVSGYTNPIIKLNGNYPSAVSINKNITFDLNGYTLSNTLTVSGGNVTLAYSPYGGTITGAVTVDAGSKLVLNGGAISGAITNNGTLEQNGSTISGDITNYGTMTTTDGVHTGALDNRSGASLTIDGGSFTTSGSPITNNGTAWIKKGTITSTGTYAVYTYSNGETIIEKLAAIHGSGYDLNVADGGKVNVNCGKFTDPNNLKTGPGSITFTSAYFQTNYSDMSALQGKHVWRNTSGAEFREGYEYFAGDLVAAQAAGVSVCHIGGTSYSKLEDALAYANNTSEVITIVMDNDYTLPSGYYTLPANATLIVPNSNTQGAGNPIVERVNNANISEFRVLTFADGVNLDVQGTIEVSAKQYSYLSGKTGSVAGEYGRLQMNKGSRMVLHSSAVLRAWGFITGDIASHDNDYKVPMGEIDVRRGAIVHELFQMGDWANTIANAQGLMSGDSRFPINSYFIQNIEVPTKYHPGSHLIAATSVSAGPITMCANDINIIGVEGEEDINGNEVPSMFKMNSADDDENTWVRKWYDASKDQQVYEINSGAHIGSLLIRLASSPLLPYASGAASQLAGSEVTLPEELILNSGQYVLPITYNFKLHLLSGTMDFTQNTAFLPGSVLEINKEATVSITNEEIEGVLAGSLYVFDEDSWPNTPGLVHYIPVFKGVPTTRPALDDAVVNVHGTFNTDQGYVLTTENGGNIFSTVEDAGTFTFTAAALTDDYSEEVKVTPSESVTFYSALLKNSAEYSGGEYVPTANTPAGKSYCFLDIDGSGGHWMSLEQRGCFTVNAKTPGEHTVNDVYYIKPQEYVAVVVTSASYTINNDIKKWTIVGNGNNTYSDAAGAGRLFILLSDEYGNDCQWWEVEAKDNYFHCIHPDNDTYYEWDEHLYPINDPDDPTHIIGYTPGWKEVRFQITWLDWNGEPIVDADDEPIVYSVPYGTQAEWLTTKPTRPASVDYTYDFTGWSPALGKVTSDVTYTATYEEKQIKYTITFVQDGGVEIERHLLARDEMPVCENVPTRTGYILQWEPAIEPVVGIQTYTATWLPEPPETYTITFKNYDGEVLLEYKDETAVVAGITPEYTGDTPTKTTATNEYNYTFAGWKPALAPATTNATYVAQFLEEPAVYAINFFEEDGETQVGETQYIPYGGYPIIPSYSKENTAQFTYSIHWADKVNGQSIQTVTKDVDYVAVVDAVTNQYSVKLVSNPSGACTLTGNGIYEYGTEVTLAVDTVANYEFTGWSDGAQKGTHSENRYSRSIIVTSDINLVANFTVEDPDYTIHWWNEAGTIELVEPVGQKANTNTIYPGATPTKKATAQYSYTFDGWATVANGERAYKKGMTPKATQDANYFAHFDATVNNYEVTVTASPASAATFSGLGTYPYNKEANAVTLTVIPNTGYNFTGWSDGQGGTNLVRQMPITGNINLVANFELVEPDYTITWMSEDGTETLAEVGHKYKTQSTYQGETPTKEATAQYTYTFDGWTSQANGAGTYFADGSTPKVMADATYYAHFIESLIVIPDMEIGITDSEDLNNEVVERKNLVITSNGIDASGELLGAESLTITGEAIFRMEKNFAAQTWYAVAVPWTVALDGIRDKNGNAFADGTVYVLEFDANAYATADREDGRTDYWHFLDQNGHDMQPGKLYMIWFRNAQTAVEFHKTSGSLWNTETSVTTTSGEGSQANWNGIANPALYYANLATGATDVLKYNGNDAYVIGTTTNMIVGEPIFVQVETPNPNVTAEVATGGASPAPAYRHAPQAATETDNRFVLELTQFGKLNDRMIVQTAEEKADTYVIGKDLAKMGLSALNAQMWISRYDAKLCKNTVALQGESVEYPLNISAPQAGGYVLSAVQERGDATLYLTYNGEAIWNLSESDYVLQLERGTAANYGLRISVKNAPQVTTGMDEALVDAQGDIRKVIINDKVFIIRGNQVYSIDGQLVK